MEWLPDQCVVSIKGEGRGGRREGRRGGGREEGDEDDKDTCQYKQHSTHSIATIQYGTVSTERIVTLLLYSNGIYNWASGSKPTLSVELAQFSLYLFMFIFIYINI